MNNFSCLTDDAIGRLATVGMEELFEKGVDEGQTTMETNEHDKATV